MIRAQTDSFSTVFLIGNRGDRSAISFMGTYIFLSSLLLPLHPSLSLDSSSTSGGPASLDGMTRVWIALIGVVAPVLVMWSRVRLGVHTPSQTLAGACLGVTKACLWFTAWNGTQIFIDTRSSIDDAASSSILRNGLRNTVGVRVDSWIAQVEANLVRAMRS